MDLFEQQDDTTVRRPLADRMRPAGLEEYVGQAHLMAKGRPLRELIENDRVPSMILWGPPGSGKTTLANLIANETRAYAVRFSAVLSGVQDIRRVVDEAKKQHEHHQRKTILFVDEIHRFSKSQQDAFLPHVESGLITLIGATTENPSFEIIPPLLSRTHVFILRRFSDEELDLIIRRATEDTARGLGTLHIMLEEGARRYIIQSAEGDARTALNNLDMAVTVLISQGDERSLTVDIVQEAVQKKFLLYDKDGEEHYNLISAFHKSLRGSDPDAALYWLGRMLAAGEDPLYIARRMVRFASEDIGNADPRALELSMSAMEAYHFLGSPEGELALAQAAVYLATSPKSNALYQAFGRISGIIQKTGYLPVPLHIRNAPTALLSRLNYGKSYLYPHDYEHAYVPQDYLPEGLADRSFYTPSGRGFEKTIQERMSYWRKIGESMKKPLKKEAPEDQNGPPA